MVENLFNAIISQSLNTSKIHQSLLQCNRTWKGLVGISPFWHFPCFVQYVIYQQCRFYSSSCTFETLAPSLANTNLGACVWSLIPVNVSSIIMICLHYFQPGWNIANILGSFWRRQKYLELGTLVNLLVLSQLQHPNSLTRFLLKWPILHPGRYSTLKLNSWSLIHHLATLGCKSSLTAVALPELQSQKIVKWLLINRHENVVLL